MRCPLILGVHSGIYSYSRLALMCDEMGLGKTLMTIAGEPFC